MIIFLLASSDYSQWYHRLACLELKKNVPPLITKLCEESSTHGMAWHVILLRIFAKYFTKGNIVETELNSVLLLSQKVKFSVKDFFCKYEQCCSLQLLTENFAFLHWFNTHFTLHVFFFKKHKFKKHEAENAEILRKI